MDSPTGQIHSTSLKPLSMKFVPDHHHELAIDWLTSRPLAALWMGMGLGKTVSTLTAFQGVQVMHGIRAMLVVAPLRVCNLTWPNEIEKWDHTCSLRVANLRTKAGWKMLLEGSAEIYLINYESLPRLCSAFLARARGVLPFQLVVFDESTMAKNPSSKRINGFRKYLDPIKYRWELTGTPNPNDLREIFAQIRLLDDGKRLGRSAAMFRDTYFHPTDYMEYNWVINGPEAEAAIYKKVSDIALTLETKDYADFAEPVVEDVECPFPDEAKEQYAELERELLLSMGNGEAPVIAPNAAVLAGKLHQLTGGAVYREDKSVVELSTTKIDTLKVLIKRLKKTDPKRTFLIACNYQHEQARLAQALPNSIRFADAASSAEQERIFHKWNQGAVEQLIVHPKSAGHGLNLQDGGYTVIWYSLPWSRELYDQLIARLCRRGQKKVVEVYRLLCSGTIDDAVAETLRQREEGQKALFNALKNLRRLAQTK